MKNKPLVCLIDEDPMVKEGWQRSLKNDATLHYCKDHLEALKKAANDRHLIASYSCIIMSRHFHHLNLDIITSSIPETFKSLGAGPIFLNWQGFIAPDELHAKFDGKLFHRYGVRWQTLRLRILKFEKKNRICKPLIPEVPARSQKVANKRRLSLSSKPERCSALLKSMAEKANGVYREKIEFYANYDQQTGIALLEAIYNQLVTNKNRPDTCPSKYINSSPVIAKRILHEALYVGERSSSIN